MFIWSKYRTAVIHFGWKLIKCWFMSSFLLSFFFSHLHLKKKVREITFFSHLYKISKKNQVFFLCLCYQSISSLIHIHNYFSTNCYLYCMLSKSMNFFAIIIHYSWSIYSVYSFEHCFLIQFSMISCAVKPGLSR